MGLIWRNTTIDGRKSLFANRGEGRLYVRERPGRFEAWHDSKKLGSFATLELARAACEKHAGAATSRIDVRPTPAAAPKPNPVILNPAPAPRYDVKQDPFLTGTPRKHLRPRKGLRYKAPVRVEEEKKLLAYPIADLSSPPTIELMNPTAGQRLIAAAKDAVDIAGGICKCGARLDRSGKCPALCEPVERPLPVYTGPAIIGHTHIGRIGAPVRMSGPGWIG